MTLMELTFIICVPIFIASICLALAGEVPPYYIVLWPVVLAKYLLRSLYFELFTGWSEKP
jgi:hypothetical protein